MLPTLAFAVPLPLVTVQVCAGLVGWTLTLTPYALPIGSAVLNVKGPATGTVRLSPPLSCRVKPVPSKPTTWPPMEAVSVEHVIATFVTLALAVPAPLETVQVCTGPVGDAKTATLYGWPLAIAALNVKVVLPVMARL